MSEHEELREIALAKFAAENFDEFIPTPIAGGMKYSFNAGFRAALESLPTPPDERIEAWHAIASHPFFRDCYATEGTLIAAMLVKLSNEPRTVTTVEELDALPVGTVIRTSEGRVARLAYKWSRKPGGNVSQWYEADDTDYQFDSDELDDLPATVLFTPSAEETP